MRIIIKLYVIILIISSCNQNSSFQKENKFRNDESYGLTHYYLDEVELENISLDLVDKILTVNGFDTDFGKGYLNINQNKIDAHLMMENVMFMDSINNNIYMIYRYPTSKFENYFLNLNTISKEIDMVYLLKSIDKIQYLKTNEFAIIKIDESEKTSDSIVLNLNKLIEISSKIKSIEFD